MDEKQLNDLVLKTYTMVNELKVQMMPPKSMVAPDWVNREQLMAFLGYGNTQMAAIEKNKDLVVAKVGKRKFYLRESIDSMLRKSTENYKKAS